MALRELVGALKVRCDSGEVTGSDVILGCRRILDLWIDLGGASLDDQVIGFLGIESQTDHILGGPRVSAGRDVDRVRFRPGSPEEAEEVEGCGRYFLDGFKRNVSELEHFLTGA